MLTSTVEPIAMTFVIEPPLGPSVVQGSDVGPGVHMPPVLDDAAVVADALFDAEVVSAAVLADVEPPVPVVFWASSPQAQRTNPTDPRVAATKAVLTIAA